MNPARLTLSLPPSHDTPTTRPRHAHDVSRLRTLRWYGVTRESTLHVLLRLGANPPWGGLALGVLVRPPRSDAERVKLRLIRSAADGCVGDRLAAGRVEVLDEAPELLRDAPVEALRSLVGALFGTRTSRLILRVATLHDDSEADLGAVFQDGRALWEFGLQESAVVYMEKATFGEGEDADGGEGGGGGGGGDDIDDSAPRSAPPKLVKLDLSLASRPLRSSVDTERRSLAEWGFVGGQRSVLYAQTRMARANEDASHRIGTQQVFCVCGAWQPPVAQSERGLSCFLSSLMVAVDHMHAKPATAEYAIGFLRALVVDFPPAPHALKLLVQRSDVSAADKHALASAVYALGRALLPATVGDGVVFESSRVVLHFLLSRFVVADNETEAGDAWQRTPLMCSLTSERLTDPVRLAAASSSADGAVFERSAVLSRIKMGLGRFADVTPEQLVTCRRTAALLLSHPRGLAALTWTDGGKPRRNPSLFEWDWGRLASTAADASFLNLCGERPGSVLRLVPTLELARASTPCLTRQAQGLVSVLVGRGKDVARSALIFEPVAGKEVQYDVQQLARQVAAALGGECDAAGGGEWQEQREPDEVIIVVLDVSNSMNQTAGFLKEDGTLDDDDKVVVNDDVHPDWGSENDQVHCLDDDEEEQERKGFSETKLEEVKARLREQELFPQIVLVTKRVVRCTRYWEELEGPLMVLHEFKTRCDEDLRYDLMLYREHLADWLLDEAKRPVTGAAEAQQEEAEGNAPRDLCCPITQALMLDPVTLADGFTYERSAVQRWLASHSTSPLTGAPLTSLEMHPNRNLKSQITTWAETAAAAAATAAAAAVVAGAVAGPASAGAASPGDSAVGLLEITVQLPPDPHSRGGQRQTTKLSVAPQQFVWELKRQVIAACYSAETTPPPSGLLVLRFKQLSDSLAHCPPLMNSQRLSDIGIGVRSGIVVASLQPGAAEGFTVKLDCLRMMRARGIAHLELWVNGAMDGAALKWRLWAAVASSRQTTNDDVNRFRPSKRTLWANLKDAGDGFSRGSVVGDGANLCEVRRQFSDSDLYEPAATETLTLVVGTAPRKQAGERKSLTRLETVRQVFFAFTNRMDAYDYKTSIGLVTFGSEVTVACAVTPFFDSFREKIDGVGATGDTKLYDAIALAADQLEAFSARHPRCKHKRVLVLSDGADTKSTTQAFRAFERVRVAGAVVDAVCVGEEESAQLHAIAKATGGYVFRPRTVRLALQLAECEPFLSLAERPARPLRQTCMRSDAQLLSAFGKARFPEDSCDGSNVPERVQDPGLSARVGSLSAALEREDAAAAAPPVSAFANPLAKARVLQEMRKLHREPHLAVDVYPCEEDCFFWRLVMEAPEESLYKGGCYLLYMRFPPNYPAQPPVVRFVTRIRHCNINSYGKVCHSILDRNWSPDTSIEMVLGCVYGLLLNPDYEDPLDSSLALEFYQASGAYEASVMEYTERHARAKSRAVWRRELEGGGADALPLALKVPEAPTQIKFLKAGEASITVGWAAPEKYSDGSLIFSGEASDSLVELEYEVQYLWRQPTSPAGAPPEMWFSAASEIHANRFKKGELVADQPYRFGVRARTVGRKDSTVGAWSAWSEPSAVFKTKPAKYAWSPGNASAMGE